MAHTLAEHQIVAEEGGLGLGRTNSSDHLGRGRVYEFHFSRRKVVATWYIWGPRKLKFVDPTPYPDTRCGLTMLIRGI